MRTSLSPRARAALPALLIAVGLTGCGDPPPEPEPLRPVRSELVRTSGGGRTRTFSGTARAGQETDLSFRAGGSVERLPINVGDTVRSGQLIARIDRTDFRIAVRQAEAELEQARATARNADADLERVRGLWENNNASRSDLDQAMAQAQSARARVEVGRQSLARAQRQLTYTSLLSPVDGSIAAVEVEVNENVVQGQTIVRLTSGAQPEIEVAIPGVLIAGIRQGDRAVVTLSALPGRSFDATVTEVGVAATGSATTFPVTVRLADGSEGIRSGMAAEVALRFAGEEDRERLSVPAHAVGQDRQGTYVFLLEPGDAPGVGSVRRAAVEVGRELLPEGRLEVLSGLVAGQRIVTAGVRRLTDGQRVKLLETGKAE